MRTQNEILRNCFQILDLSLHICRKYTQNRAAGENLTVVPYCLNQFQWPENAKKLTENCYFCYFLHFLVNF